MKNKIVPIYMDVHIVPGVKPLDAATAHDKDLQHQEEFGCSCMTYWVDEDRGNVFCLIDAPDKEAVEGMHRKSHGLIPYKIIEVSKTVVRSFLGRIYDPESVAFSEEGFPVFADHAFRILLLTKITDPHLLRYQFGSEKANELLNDHNQIIRQNVNQFGGEEIEHEGNDFIISFSTASKAMACALEIQQEMLKAHSDKFVFKIGINAGEPVETANEIFGDTIGFADNMCFIAANFQIAVASPVKELMSKDFIYNDSKKLLALTPKDENLLKLLFRQLEEKWQNPHFRVTDYCKATAMSASQLYRKTISLTGLSPNMLLKEFRLEKAMGLMRKQPYNIAQITFDSGFTSASYFTKCFKKKFSLLPMAYLELLH